MYGSIHALFFLILFQFILYSICLSRSAEDLKERFQNGEFPAGSMAPKVRSVLQFIDATGGTAAIGALSDVNAVVQGVAGTQIHPNE